MRSEQTDFETCLVLSLRHLGDAVIVSGFINALAKRYPGMVIDVLGRDDFRGITEELCSVRDYIPIEIPVFGHHARTAPSVIAAFRTIARLRSTRYDCCINLTGDVRENTIARVVGVKRIIAPAWNKDHPFRKHIRTFFARKSRPNWVGLTSNTGYYRAMELFAEQLDLGELFWPQIGGSEESARMPVVGIHPGASHVGKQWPIEKWRALIRRLAAWDVAIRIYGAPSEEASLCGDFQREIEEFEIDLVTCGISGFLQSLRSLDVLVCVDSFSCHAAHAVGIPTVVLFGPFDPAVMKPPTGTALSAGNQCPMFPCYNGRSCNNTQHQFVCVRGIAVDAVISEVEATLTRSDLSQRRKQPLGPY